VPNLKELSEKDAIGRGAAQLSPEELGPIKEVTQGAIADCVKDPGPWVPKTAGGIFKALRVKRVVLTADGVKGLVVQGYSSCMCGATGNCPIWIIGEGSAPQLLLHRDGVQNFAVEETHSSDLFDLVFGSHYSAMESYLQRFQFDGSKYRRTGCATLEWSDPVGNRFDPPRIKVMRCD